VYKNYDPRARIIKQVAEEVFEVTAVSYTHLDVYKRQMYARDLVVSLRDCGSLHFYVAHPSAAARPPHALGRSASLRLLSPVFVISFPRDLF